MEMNANMDLAIKIEHVSKEYRLGAIGGGTLRGDLQSWWARKRGKEDPNSKIGAQTNVKAGQKFLALDDINLEVKKGEALGIIGHNGAGKSTLLKLLSRVTAPTTGSISYNGRIASMLEVGTGFHPELTGRENVYMNGAILGMTKAEIDRKFDQIVEFAEMEQFINTPVKRYSSGMYVKLAFSVAAHLDSEILVMDEVLAVGDMKFQQKCLGKMGDAANREGRTVLYVSHNMNTIRQLCSRCIVLDHGRIVFDGNTEQAIEKYMECNMTTETAKSYADYQRLAFLQRDDVRILSANYIGKDSCVFQESEKLPLHLQWKYQKDVPDMSLRFVVEGVDQTKVCASFCYHAFSGRQGEISSADLCFDITQLAPGNYQSFYVFFASNEYGTDKELDWVPGLSFTVEKQTPGRLPWRTPAWGRLELLPPEISNYQRNNG